MDYLIYVLFVFIAIMFGATGWFFYNKKRKQNQVKAIVFESDKRVRVYYRVPKDNNITIGNKTYIINNVDFYLDSNSYPTYTYRFDSTEPINPMDNKKSILTPDYYNTAINNKVARDIFEASNKGMDINIGVLLSGLAFVGVLVVWYLLDDKMTGMASKINELYDIIKALSGGAA